MFKPIFIEATDLDDAWFRLLWNLFEHGRKYYISKGSYEGQYRYSFDFVSGFVQHPHKRPLAPRMPESSTLPPPTTDHEIEQYFANYLMDSNLASNEDYRYATWIVGGWYKLPAINGWEYLCSDGNSIEVDYIVDGDTLWINVPNQLEWIIQHFLKKGKGNAHCYLSVGYPESNFAYDIPYENEMERRTSPCLRGLDFRVIDNCLTTHVIYRSWDLVGGFPTNMGGFTLLNEYVADVIGVDPGPLTFSCKDLHAYGFSYKYLTERIGK
jgi:thymidylate synthase